MAFKTFNLTQLAKQSRSEIDARIKARDRLAKLRMLRRSMLDAARLGRTSCVLPPELDEGERQSLQGFFACSLTFDPTANTVNW